MTAGLLDDRVAPRPLTEEELARFERDGYAVIEGVLDPVRDLQPFLDERNALLTQTASRLVAEGKVSSTYEDVPLPERLMRLAQESGTDFSNDLDITLYARPGERAPGQVSAALMALLTTPRLLDVVGSVVGEEITSSPIQHFRWKLPKAMTAGSTNALLMRTPWHQDAAVVEPDADDTPVLTVWIPLCDVPVELGPLCVIPGSHQGGMLTHCPRASGLTVADAELPAQEPVALPVKAGDVILQNRFMVHASLDNRSADQVRLSLDVRYQRTGLPSGRSYLPTFVARSASDPGSEQRDGAAWVAQWDEVRESLLTNPPDLTQRWPAGTGLCA